MSKFTKSRRRPNGMKKSESGGYQHSWSKVKRSNYRSLEVWTPNNLYKRSLRTRRYNSRIRTILIRMECTRVALRIKTKFLHREKQMASEMTVGKRTTEWTVHLMAWMVLEVRATLTFNLLIWMVAWKIKPEQMILRCREMKAKVVPILARTRWEISRTG